MKDSTRARVAAVVAAAFRKTSVSSVYDYQAGRHRFTSANASSGRVSGYDHDTSSHFSGGSSDLDFYDYETSSHVQLRLEENRFSGYDYHTGAHFQGTISGNSITLYDYQTGQHYNFSTWQL